MCVCVCLCVNILETTRPNLSYLLHMLPLPMAQSASGGVAICYVLPVLCMTLFFHNGQYGGSALPRQHRCNVVHELTLLAVQCWLHRVL